MHAEAIILIAEAAQKPQHPTVAFRELSQGYRIRPNRKAGPGSFRTGLGNSDGPENKFQSRDGHCPRIASIITRRLDFRAKFATHRRLAAGSIFSVLSSTSAQRNDSQGASPSCALCHVPFQRNRCGNTKYSLQVHRKGLQTSASQNVCDDDFDRPGISRCETAEAIESVRWQ